MNELIRLFTKIFDQTAFAIDSYMWIGLAIVVLVIAFSPIGRKVWEIIKAVVNGIIYLPTIVLFVCSFEAFRNAYTHHTIVGFAVGILFALVGSYVFHKFRGVKFI